VTGRVDRLVVGVLFLALGCERSESGGVPPGATVPTVASARVERAPTPGLAALVAAADVRVEARRGVLGGPTDAPPSLVAALEQHHAGVVPYPLAVQVAPTTGGGAAILFQATSGEGRPLVVAVGANLEPRWTKSHPMGGVKPGATEATLASGPNGHVALSWCNPGSGTVALRQWAADGGAFADYEAARFESCEALSVLYWPKKGWLLGVASASSVLLSRITDDGALAWGREGLTLPWTFRGPAPVSFALDALGGFFLARLGLSGGPDSPEFVFVSRHDTEGRQTWPGPLSVKRLDAPSRGPFPRVHLSPTPDGNVRMSVTPEVSGSGIEVAVTVAPDGAVVRSGTEGPPHTRP
jgi:hypothetical protein